MNMPATNVTDLDDKRLVPMTAHVPVRQRRRVKILAARLGVTMSRLQVQIFEAGLDLLEASQDEKEAEK